MSSLNNFLLDPAIPDQCQLKQRGWSEEALPARAGVVQILQGWLASERVDLETLPPPAELTPLLAQCAKDTPAASEAALLLALLETGRCLASNQVNQDSGA